MKLSTIFAGAALAITGTSAQQAVVHNHCNVPIYVQSFPYDGGNPGQLTTVAPGQAFREDFRKSGSVRLPLPRFFRRRGVGVGFIMPITYTIPKSA